MIGLLPATLIPDQYFSDYQLDQLALTTLDSIDRDLMKWAIPAIAGLMGSVGAIATGHLGLAVPSGGFVIGGVNELIQAKRRRLSLG